MKEFQLAARTNRIDTSLIRKMFDLAGTLKNPINLSIGQPHFGTPEPILAEMEKALRDGKTAYTPTQGILPLRERLAKKFQEENKIQAEPDNILVSSGVSSLLQLLFMVLIEEGDRALLVDPYFLIHRSMLDFFGAKVELVREEFTAEDVAKVDPEGLKLIMFSSPSNPSGRIITEEQIRLLGDLADKSGALMVSDEIYELFDYDNKFNSAASIYPDAVTLMGFSKTYSMTGLRLAAATGPKQIMQAMIKLQQYTIVCAPAPVQWAGIVGLDIDMSSYVDNYRENRDYTLKTIGDKLNCGSPDGAFYVFPEIPGKALDFVERSIKEKELLIVPGNIFTPDENRIRISYATERATLERGLQALLELL